MWRGAVLAPAAVATWLVAATDAAANCTVDLDVRPRPEAVLDVVLQAPCMAGAAVVLRHEGLVVGDKLDQAGLLALSFPALGQGGVEITLPGGQRIRQVAEVPDLGTRHHLALQWQGQDGLSLIASGQRPEILGDPDADWPMLAQVIAVSGDVQVDADVTPATCGRDLLGETLELRNGELQVRELTVAMPDCEAAAGMVVVPDLLAD